MEEGATKLINTDTILSFFNSFSNADDPLFSSSGELFFYGFCMIALHMIIVNMFYGGRGRRRHASLNVKRSLILMLVIAEIVIFTNLLTIEHFENHAQNHPSFSTAKISHAR